MDSNFLSQMKREQLVNVAVKAGIDVDDTMKKADLLKLIRARSIPRAPLAPRVLTLDKSREFGHSFAEGKPDWYIQDGNKFSMSEPHALLKVESGLKIEVPPVPKVKEAQSEVRPVQ